jgi:hypothetical protein
VDIAADPIFGFGGRKAPNSMGKISTAEVLRLRAANAVSRDPSVRRSAQDDESAWEFDGKHQALCHVTSLWEFDGKHQALCHVTSLWEFEKEI